MEYVVETEKEIVQNYIIKSKQERIEWELSHSKKRKDIIWHFHKPDIFKEACLHAVDYMDKEAMKNYLHKLSGAENVYFIGEDYIGEMLLEQAATLNPLKITIQTESPARTVASPHQSWQ